MFERCFLKHVTAAGGNCEAPTVKCQNQHWYRNLYITRAAVQSTGNQDIQVAWYFNFYQLQDVGQLVQTWSKDHLHSKNKALLDHFVHPGELCQLGSLQLSQQLQKSYQCYHLLLSLSGTLPHPHQCPFLSGNTVFSHPQNVLTLGLVNQAGLSILQHRNSYELLLLHPAFTTYLQIG